MRICPQGTEASVTDRKKAKEEEYDYVAGHHKLNYLNVHAVIEAEGVRTKL